MIYKLSQICNMQSGGTPRRGSSEFYGGDIPWIKISDFKDGLGGVITETEETITREGLQSINNRLFEKGTLLLAMYGSVGKTAFTGIQASCNQAILGITAKDENQLNLKYLKYWFDLNQGSLVHQGRGVTLNNISLDIVKKQEIDLPDLGRQNKIVAILDKASALVQKRQQAINLLDELLRAQFLRMFGMQNPDFASWKEIEIQDLAKAQKGSMRTGPFGSSLKHDEFTEDGDVAVLGIDNAVNNEFRWDKKRFIKKDRYNESFKRYTVFPRDVIITIMGTVGRSAVIPDDIPLSINTKHLACITLDETKCNPYYLAYSIHSNPFIAFQMKARNRGAIMEGLNLGIIKTLKLKNAPISLQNRFEELYSSTREKQTLLKRSESETQVLLNALLQKVFSGKLDINVSLELESLLEEIDLHKPENDLFGIITNEEYLLSLVNRLNNQKFESQDLYDKAKHAAFQLLKAEERLAQEYDQNSQSIKLVLK